MDKITIKPFEKINSGKININDYISEAGLDGLCVLEAHDDTKKVQNMRKNNVSHDLTGLYGIKDSAIKEVKARAKEAGIKLPKEMEDINSASQLGKGKEDVARMYAGYFAWVNDTKMNQLTDNAFSSYTPHQRDVLLSYLHNIDVSQLKIGTKGSLIDAIKLHNEDEVIRRIFMKSDGSLVDYETFRKENKRGVVNRWMALMQWWYNPQADVVQSIRQKDELYSNTYNKVGHMKNMLAANAYLVEDTKRRKNDNIQEQLTPLQSMFPRPYKMQEQTERQLAEAKTVQNEVSEPSAWERFTNSIRPFLEPLLGNKDKVASLPQNILNNTKVDEL